MLTSFALQGFVTDINAKGRTDLYNTLFKNFTAEDEQVRIQSIKLMSLLVAETAIHDMVLNITDFQFLCTDIEEMSAYPNLYPEEQDMLVSVLRIFAELSKTPRIAELNLSNSILSQSARILSESKFTKEPKIWALTIINRCCMIQLNTIN